MAEPSDNGGFLRIRNGELGVAADIELDDRFLDLGGRSYTLQPAEGGRGSGPALRQALQRVREQFEGDEQLLLDSGYTSVDDFKSELEFDGATDEELPAKVYKTLTEEPPDEACTRLRKLLGLC